MGRDGGGVENGRGGVREGDVVGAAGCHPLDLHGVSRLAVADERVLEEPHRPRDAARALRDKRAGHHLEDAKVDEVPMEGVTHGGPKQRSNTTNNLQNDNFQGSKRYKPGCCLVNIGASPGLHALAIAGVWQGGVVVGVVRGGGHHTGQEQEGDPERGVREAWGGGGAYILLVGGSASKWGWCPGWWGGPLAGKRVNITSWRVSPGHLATWPPAGQPASNAGHLPTWPLNQPHYMRCDRLK